MEIKPYLLIQFASMQSQVDAAFTGLTDEQLTWIPGGTANPIGLTALHMLASEDYFIALLSGAKRVWESQGWKEKFNLDEPPDIGQDWTVFRSGSMTVDLIRGYLGAVRQKTNAYLEQITPTDLDRTLKFIHENDTVAFVLALLANHSLMHAGEIAALKGVHGEKGLPY